MHAESAPEAAIIQQARAPMEWPRGSIYARQTSMLKWLASLGHAVDYGPEPALRRMTAAETSAWLRACGQEAKRTPDQDADAGS